jgi:hypothetical protein
MALHTLGTNANNSLNCLAGWSQVLLPADLAAISQSITGDDNFATILSGLGFGAQAVLATGSTHASATLDTLVVSAGGAALSSIQVSDLVLGVGIVPGTYVTGIISGTSVLLSQAASGNAAGVHVAFVRWGPDQDFAGGGLAGNGGLLTVPGRGTLKVLPGDVVALDPTTGWPILISGAAISAAGSVFTFT